MTASSLFAMLGFLWITAITPGPNNTLLMASGAQVGFQRSLGLLIGIVLGVQTLLLLTALGLGSLFSSYPALHLWLKILGSCYLLWLAWGLITSAYKKINAHQGERCEGEEIDHVGCWQGLLLQFLNPKAWLMVLGTLLNFSQQGEAYLLSVLILIFCILMINLLAGVIWISFGSAISQFLQSERAWYVFNVSMGILTAACVLMIWY